MKKKLIYLLVGIIVLVIVNSCFAETNKIQSNRVVVTFSPLVVNNINHTDKLFDLLSNRLKNNPEISKKLESCGALWSISNNLCGLQICISSSKDISELYTIIELLMTSSLKESEKILTGNKTDIKSIDRLYQFFIDSDSNFFSSQPVTIRFFDYTGKEIENYYASRFVTEKESNNSDLADFQSSQSQNGNPLPDEETAATNIQNNLEVVNRNDFIKDYQNIYNSSYKTNQKSPEIQSVSKPILARILGWDKLNPENFISASLIKNKFISENFNNNSFSIELINSGKGLVLVVYCEVENNENIYNKYLTMNRKIDLSFKEIGTKEWNAWSSKLIEVLKNDNRNLNKKAMFESWIKHWSGTGFDNISSNIKFVKPNIRKDIEIFSSLSEHTFALSANKFPAIYANCDESLPEGANIAVCIKGHSQILESIENNITSTLQISVPITIDNKNPECIILSFYCPEKRIPAYLSRIKASISEHLYSKFSVFDLKKSIKIGIAGLSSIPAYRLNGLLTLGWPTKSARYEASKAKDSDLYKLVTNDSSFDNNLKLRWNNMISSPQDKANILSILACDNLIIDSWERN